MAPTPYPLICIFFMQVSKTYGSAKLKKLQETIEALHEIGLEDEDIQFSGEFDKYDGKPPDDVVNAELIRQKNFLNNLVQEKQEYLVNKLSET